MHAVIQIIIHQYNYVLVFCDALSQFFSIYMYIFKNCMHILYECIVWIYCMDIFYGYVVGIYCMDTLYTGTVWMYCIVEMLTDELYGRIVWIYCMDISWICCLDI